jgi:hypothetical protein
VDFHESILPVASIAVVGEETFERAFAQQWAPQLRYLNTVDLTSFGCMHRRTIVYALAFGRYFQNQGFAVSAG